jgi:hypothetical protein
MESLFSLQRVEPSMMERCQRVEGKVTATATTTTQTLNTQHSTLTLACCRYVEMDASIHKFNILARKALHSMQDRIKEFEARLAFVIEGVTNDELPETLLGTVYLHNVDLPNTVKLFPT